MTNHSALLPSRASSRCFSTIAWAGLVAGVLDLSFATVSSWLRGKTFFWLLKLIAGGALGPDALQGGWGIAALGLAFHFCISFGAATVYYAASRKLSTLNRHAWIAGLIYGLFVYEFMHLVVLPLSAYHSPLKFPPLFVPDVLSHLFFVGLPIALIVRRYSRLNERPTEPS
jgi:uncharacterized membrane protein YagU involved in acid resistance